MSKHSKRGREFSRGDEGFGNRARAAYDNRLYYARAYEGRAGLKEALARGFMSDSAVSNPDAEPVST